MTQITMTHEELLGLVFEAAGAATGPLMRDHPDYTFPSEEVAAAVTRVIEEKTDITVANVPGYAGVRGATPTRVIVDDPMDGFDPLGGGTP